MKPTPLHHLIDWLGQHPNPSDRLPDTGTRILDAYNALVAYRDAHEDAIKDCAIQEDADREHIEKLESDMELARELLDDVLHHLTKKNADKKTLNLIERINKAEETFYGP
jgi:hypothetical protein